jgi:hypothetical protein
VGGCSNDPIQLESDTDGGTDDGTATSTADSGSDDGPFPECDSNSQCGDCGYCEQGVCYEDFGCCSAQPEQPWVWHCSPPEECYEDVDCGDGMVCNFGMCEPAPRTDIFEPPACRGDIAFEVRQLALELPIVQIAAIEGLGLQGIDAELRPVEIDLMTGSTSTHDPLAGSEAVDLLPIEGGMAMAIMRVPDADGEAFYQLDRTAGAGDTFSVEAGPLTPGSARAAAWAGMGTLEVVTAIDARLERWNTEALATLGDYGFEGVVQTVTTFEPLDDAAPFIAATAVNGITYVVDPSMGGVVAASEALVGEPVDAVERGVQILSLSFVSAEIFGASQDMAAIRMLDLDPGSLPASAPFGAPGVPLALATADIDGDGVDDVLVANADGRLDIYFMQAEGASCRTFLPFAAALDLETGDVNGDGHMDVLIADADAVLTVIFGAGAP